MSSVDPSVPDAFATGLESALSQAESVIRSMIAGASQALMHSASATQDVNDRNVLVEARQVLLRKQDALLAAFPPALATQVAEASKSGVVPATAPKLDFDALELMGEEQVDDTVELVRAQEAVTRAVEGEIVQLNALVSAARGLRMVRAASNPLLPEVWVRALREATLKCNVDDALRLRWMQYLAAALGDQLAVVYRHVSAVLRSQGVAAASFEINQAAVRAPVSRDPAAAQEPHAPRAATSPERSSGALTLRDLRKLLVGDGKGRPRAERGAESVGTQGLTEPGSGYTLDPGLTVPAAFEALKELQQSSAIFARMRERQAAQARKGSGTADGATPAALTPVQTLSQEVVRLMVDNIAADPRLLAPVGNLVRQLEPALLRLALADPRFFSDKSHPARVLLEEITGRSLAWSSASQAGFKIFMEPLSQAVQVLTDLRVDSAEPFEFALDTLRHAWSEAEEKARRARAVTAGALQKAETRNIEAGKIAAEMQSRSDILGATAEVRRFVMGPWCQVMAAAQLAQPLGGQQANDYAALVNDLIWSTQPRLTSANPARLAKLLPPMLATLRTGLASIEYPAAAMQQFLDRLAEIHQEALRPPGAQAPASGPSPIRTRADAEPAAPAGPPDAWLSASEAQESGLMQMIDKALMTNFETTAIEARAMPVDGGSPAVEIDKLAPGTYLEVLVKGAWVRWRLAWVSSQTLLFMFTNGAGKPESMTRQMLERMAEMGAVRLVSDRSVVTGALDAVAQAALRNSMMNPTIL